MYQVILKIFPTCGVVGGAWYERQWAEESILVWISWQNLAFVLAVFETLD